MHPSLFRQIRNAHVERIADASARAQLQLPELPGMPTKLLCVGIFLASQGFDDARSEGERWFGMDFDVYRSAISPLMVEEGRRACFEGRHPMVARFIEVRDGFVCDRIAA